MSEESPVTQNYLFMVRFVSRVNVDAGLSNGLAGIVQNARVRAELQVSNGPNHQEYDLSSPMEILAAGIEKGSPVKLVVRGGGNVLGVSNTFSTLRSVLEGRLSPGEAHTRLQQDNYDS